MQPKEPLSLSLLEQQVFVQRRSKNYPGQTFHSLANYSVQRELWDVVLNQVDPVLSERIKQLLPMMPVTEQSQTELFQTYDCVGFALYVLGPNFLEDVQEVTSQNGLVRQPKVKSLGWREKPWWKTDELQNFGFGRVNAPSDDSPTLVVITLEDENFVYTQPVHFAIYLGTFDGKPYVAQKANQQYLPEILPLEQVIDVYRGESGSLNETPGVQFWQLSK